MGTNYIYLVPLLFSLVSSADFPTLYELYTAEGISSGLSVDQPYFTLNGKNISIYSGSIHYFRIPPEYWQDRLRKLRAAGLNAVVTVIPWNLHEPQNGVFDFGDGGSEMEQFLNVETFIQLAQEEDLFVVLRPGPYISADWEWGGLPSWLLAEDVAVRTSDETYFYYVERYFNQLLPILAKYQFTRGGPVIAFQIENDYKNSPYYQPEHIQQLSDLMIAGDIVELLYTSDNITSTNSSAIGSILQMVNSFDPVSVFGQLGEEQPNKPLMAMEFYTGWFDNWSENHSTLSTESFRDLYGGILAYPASVNLYMFHGGSNWGFFNGATPGTEDNSHFQPHTTSYDFDAPLNEAGDYTDKYDTIKELIEQYNPIKTRLPDPPAIIERQTFPSIKVDSYLSLNDVINQAQLNITSEGVLPMEKLPINNGSGQSYGYIVYRQENLYLKQGSAISIADHVRDSLMVLVDGQLVSPTLTNTSGFDVFGFWRVVYSSLLLSTGEKEDTTVDLVVENWGRGNAGLIKSQFKGLTDKNIIQVNNGELNTSWVIYPLEFKKAWITQLSGWKSVEDGESLWGPGLYKATLTIDDSQNYDNFIDMEGWKKGLVIVNGFPLGKYVMLGPQQSIYLPRPLLRVGDNEIIIFEHFAPAPEIKFSNTTIFYNL